MVGPGLAPMTDDTEHAFVCSWPLVCLPDVSDQALAQTANVRLDLGHFF